MVYFRATLLKEIDVLQSRSVCANCSSSGNQAHLGYKYVNFYFYIIWNVLHFPTYILLDHIPYSAPVSQSWMTVRGVYQ